MHPPDCLSHSKITKDQSVSFKLLQDLHAKCLAYDKKQLILSMFQIVLLKQ